MTIPINLFTWSVAILPVVFLLGVMIKLNWSASKAAPCAMAIAAVSALTLFRQPPFAIGVESLKGVWNAVVILLVVWPAIFIYEMSIEANAYNALKDGIQKITGHELLQIIILGWVFPSFLQGITGFGVAVAVGAPLLVGIGVAPFWSVVVVLLCHSWGATFGTLSLSWQALLTETQITGQTAAATALVACVIIWLYNFVGGFTLCWLYGKTAALKEGWPLLLIVSAIQGGGQLVIAQFNPTVACFLPACVALVVAVLLGRTKRYGHTWRMEDSHIMERPPDGIKQPDGKKGLSFGQSLFPYAFLTGITVLVLLVPPVTSLLGQWQVGFSFPGTETGYGYATLADSFFSPLTPFTYAGTLLIITSAAGYWYFSKKGGITRGGFGRIFRRTIHKTVPSSIAIVGLIVMSKIMGSSGQIYVLAQGVAQVMGKLYIIVAPLIGMLGSFVTSSNMSSNILFSNFQMTTAELLGVNVSLLLGAQTAGGVIGTSIAPGSVVLGTSTTGITGKEGAIIRTVLPISAAVAVVSGLLLFLLVLL